MGKVSALQRQVKSWSCQNSNKFWNHHHNWPLYITVPYKNFCHRYTVCRYGCSTLTFDITTFHCPLTAACTVHWYLPFLDPQNIVCDLKFHNPLPYKYGELQCINIVSGTWPTTSLPCKTATACKYFLLPFIMLVPLWSDVHISLCT